MKVNNIEYLVGKKAKLTSALEPFNSKIINLLDDLSKLTRLRQTIR